MGPATGPWIRTKQVARVVGPHRLDGLAQLVDRKDQVLGWGLYSEASSIAMRMLSWDDAALPEDWLGRRVAAAVHGRVAHRFASRGTTGVRLVNSEGDGLPGLVVDRYGVDVVVQITTAPMFALRASILAALREEVERTHVIVPDAAAKREGITAETTIDGAPEALVFEEDGLRFSVDPPPAQKTGAYFDQRANRSWIAELAARTGGTLLDVGCHVGGFALQAARRGVSAIGVDSSARALELAATNAAAAGLTDVRWVRADMFGALDDAALAGPFGTIVLDPPKIATRRAEVDRATTALMRTFGRLAPRVTVGGHVAVCSCSHHLGEEQLDRVVLGGARGTVWTRVKVLGADVDHPVAPGHREGRYLVVSVYQRRS